ncbi:12303_t:CDS:2 [Rhizophagus irregularis]|nr:12303_t:CDS:2 [Rhizophagus irregularis]
MTSSSSHLNIKRQRPSGSRRSALKKQSLETCQEKQKKHSDDEFLNNMKNYRQRTNDIELINDDDGEISWKFDYRIGNYIINSIDLRLPLGMLNNSASIQWFIKSLPTMKNQNPTWNLIQFNQNIHHVKEIEDVTRFVKNEYGFILMARLRDDDEKQDLNKLIFFRDIDDESFGFDVRVELKPDIIIDPLPELLFSDYESINDFIIHYEFSTEDDQNIGSSGNSNKKSREFHVNSKILSERSDYFNTYDKWITLLRYSSKFLIPTLIQRCEKALKGYLNHDNLCEVENIANECDAKQLLRCCQNLNCLN